MKYQDIIDALTPYANEDVDALMVVYTNEVSFWVEKGEIEIVSFIAHE